MQELHRIMHLGIWSGQPDLGQNPSLLGRLLRALPLYHLRYITNGGHAKVETNHGGVR